MQLSQEGQKGVSRSSSSNARVAKLPRRPLSFIVYRNSEKYSLPSAAFQYLNSINSLGLPMIETEKPVWMREETPRTIPSSTPRAAIWSQELVPPGDLSTGCPIWTPSSVTMAGAIEAVEPKLFMLPAVTQRGMHGGAGREGETTPSTAASLRASAATRNGSA